MTMHDDKRLYNLMIEQAAQLIRDNPEDALLLRIDAYIDAYINAKGIRQALWKSMSNRGKQRMIRAMIKKAQEI